MGCFSLVFSQKRREGRKKCLGSQKPRRNTSNSSFLFYLSLVHILMLFKNFHDKTAPNSVGNRNGGVAQWQGTYLAGIWPSSAPSLADSQSRLWPAPPPQCPVALMLIWGLCEKLPTPQHSHAHYPCSLLK